MSTLRKVSLQEKFSAFDDMWSPKTLATVNDYAIKAVKIDGEFVWHQHADDDEIFLVLAGGITMYYRLNGIEEQVDFGPGELLRIPRGVEHKPIAKPGTEMLLFERADLLNTGNIRSDRFTAKPAAI